MILCCWIGTPQLLFLHWLCSWIWVLGFQLSGQSLKGIDHKTCKGHWQTHTSGFLLGLSKALDSPLSMPVSVLCRTLLGLSKALDSPCQCLSTHGVGYTEPFHICQKRLIAPVHAFQHMKCATQRPPGFAWRIPHSCSVDKVYVAILQCMDASVWLRFSRISFCLGIWLCLHFLLEDYMCTLVLAFSLIILNEGLDIHCMCFCYDVLVESVCCHHNLWFLWWDGVSLQVSFLLPCQVCIPCLASASK